MAPVGCVSAAKQQRSTPQGTCDSCVRASACACLGARVSRPVPGLLRGCASAHVFIRARAAVLAHVHARVPVRVSVDARGHGVRATATIDSGDAAGAYLHREAAAAAASHGDPNPLAVINCDAVCRQGPLAAALRCPRGPYFSFRVAAHNPAQSASVGLLMPSMCECGSVASVVGGEGVGPSRERGRWGRLLSRIGKDASGAG